MQLAKSLLSASTENGTSSMVLKENDFFYEKCEGKRSVIATIDRDGFK